MTKIITKTRNQKSCIIEEMHLYNILFDTREIFLHGEYSIDSDSGVDFHMSNRFLKNMRLLENTGQGPIIIHQHSIGGEWEDGMLIYDTISTSKCHIIFIMHGTACSMGSIVPQAADTRIIMPNCTFLAHDGNTGIDGHLTYQQSQEWGSMEARTRDIMLDIYCGVCINGIIFQKEQKDSKKLRQYLIEKLEKKQDWWLFARDAVNHGFADAVLGDDGYETIDSTKEFIINGD